MAAGIFGMRRVGDLSSGGGPNPPVIDSLRRRRFQSLQVDINTAAHNKCHVGRYLVVTIDVTFCHKGNPLLHWKSYGCLYS